MTQQSEDNTQEHKEKTPTQLVEEIRDIGNRMINNIEKLFIGVMDKKAQDNTQWEERYKQLVDSMSQSAPFDNAPDMDGENKIRQFIRQEIQESREEGYKEGWHAGWEINGVEAVAAAKQQTAREILVSISENQKGQFVDEGGNICWYLGDLINQIKKEYGIE